MPFVNIAKGIFFITKYYFFITKCLLAICSGIPSQTLCSGGITGFLGAELCS
jgi:hypothetical protein